MDFERSYPRFAPGMTQDEKLGAVMDYLYGVKEYLRYLMGNLGAENFNDAGLEEIQAGAVRKTVQSLSIEATNGYDSSVVKLKADGVELSSQQIRLNGAVTFTDLSGSGTTVINGANIVTGSLSADKVSGGTLEGVTVISSDGVCGALMNVGTVVVYSPIGNGSCKLSFDPFTGRAQIEAFDCVLKITGESNVSIDADGTVYIGSDTGGSGNVMIGQPGGTVNLYGDVYVNGVQI